MTATRTMAVCVLAWFAMGSLVQAAPLSWYGSQNPSPAWYANRISSDGSFYAPRGSSAALVPYGWWNNPEYSSAPAPALKTFSTSANVLSAASSITAAPVSNSTSTTADAYINFGNGPYANASALTVGAPQAWYNSPSVIQAFGGSSPDSQQQANFQQQVLSNIERTFQNSGINVNLTTDPNTSSPHTMSVVSGASYGSNPNAIGITEVGGSGFGFIDKLSYANSPDQLAMAVAHNLSHELMHALGVSSHPDSTGQYLDSATATWSMLTDPNAKFSPAAVQMMQAGMEGSGLGTQLGAQLLDLSKHQGNCHCQSCNFMHALGIDGAQILAQPVPEPSTIAIWALAGLGAAATIRRRSRRLVV